MSGDTESCLVLQICEKLGKSNGRKLQNITPESPANAKRVTLFSKPEIFSIANEITYADSFCCNDNPPEFEVSLKTQINLEAAAITAQMELVHGGTVLSVYESPIQN
ncbi:hypothetical protein CEXT_213861 [Caerostris extrusa]|uniref:Uncharacterized protein n=1 Tax=Caerostris extrusa TaxID=172846 RepID=A0AAV4MTJ6_CAEEX|nr:hypothetical protein CEXT_213861 [Caerostris extrusa]